MGWQNWWVFRFGNHSFLFSTTLTWALDLSNAMQFMKIPSLLAVWLSVVCEYGLVPLLRIPCSYRNAWRLRSRLKWPCKGPGSRTALHFSFIRHAASILFLLYPVYFLLALLEHHLQIWCFHTHTMFLWNISVVFIVTIVKLHANVQRETVFYSRVYSLNTDCNMRIHWFQNKQQLSRFLVLFRWQAIIPQLLLKFKVIPSLFTLSNVRAMGVACETISFNFNFVFGVQQPDHWMIR